MLQSVTVYKINLLFPKSNYRVRILSNYHVEHFAYDFFINKTELQTISSNYMYV